MSSIRMVYRDAANPVKCTFATPVQLAENYTSGVTGQKQACGLL